MGCKTIFGDITASSSSSTLVHIRHILFSVFENFEKDVDLIPRQPSSGCPAGSLYREGLGTCSCQDDHCNWDLCLLKDPPITCLEGTYSKWEWDNLKHAWVAQVIQGTHFICKI